MNLDLNNIEVLILNANRIIKHQEEIKILRGENFNLFSILKMESKENSTHSAFLGELLDPNGSHLFKSLFLEDFLNTIDYKGNFEIKTAKLILEKHVGSKENDTKQGGRIDIYIYDANGNTISIENKIYANDQPVQIERYVNHNKNRNTVYYLTLNGDVASEKSKGQTLKEGVDYFCISYKNTIIDWLNKCIKESAEQPIIRETIKQYILLIKKLTNQLTDNKMTAEIQEIIKNNYNSVKIIEANISKVELDETYQFLMEIKLQLEKVLINDWTITVDEDLYNSWTGLRIANKNWNGIILKLEGESKIPWSITYYGIVADKNIWDRADLKGKLDKSYLLQNTFKESDGWPYYKTILDFRITEERSKLFNKDKRAEMVANISSVLIELARECEMPLSSIKQLKTNII